MAAACNSAADVDAAVVSVVAELRLLPVVTREEAPCLYDIKAYTHIHTKYDSVWYEAGCEQTELDI